MNIKQNASSLFYFYSSFSSFQIKSIKLRVLLSRISSRKIVHEILWTKYFVHNSKEIKITDPYQIKKKKHANYFIHSTPWTIFFLRDISSVTMKRLNVMHSSHHPVGSTLNMLSNVQSWNMTRRISNILRITRRNVLPAQKSCRHSRRWLSRKFFGDGKETSGREMNPKSSLKRNRAPGALLEYLTTCVPGRSSARKSQLKCTCTYVSVRRGALTRAHRDQEWFLGFAKTAGDARHHTVINIKAGTSFRHYQRHLSSSRYKHGIIDTPYG